MAQASRDQNFVPTLLAVSSVDGVTPVTLYADPTSHRLLTDLAGGGTGTVTSVSVVTANGFSGTVATATSTPAITLTTSLTTGSVIFASSSALSQDNDNFFWNSSVQALELGDGVATSTIDSKATIYATKASTTFFLPVQGQNTSNSTTASTDFITANDAATDTTNYLDLGINSSTNTDPAYTIIGASGGYLYNQSGDLALGTATAAKIIKLFTGGTLAANERMRVDDARVSTTVPVTITSNSATSLAVGLNGATNPAFQIDASVASSVTGILLSSAATGNGVTLQATDSGSNTALTIQSKGTGTLTLGAGGAGNVMLQTNGSNRISIVSTASLSLTGVTAIVSNPSSVSNAASTVRLSYLSAADASLTASTEAPWVYFNGANAVRNHATGALTLQRDFRITGTTHTFTGASALTDLAAFAIDTGLAGNNATVTNMHGLYIPASSVVTGTGVVTNSYGITVNAQTGAGTNYAAQFLGGQAVFGGNLIPSANDGAALGTATLSFSDLFLASGAVINIANGNWVATHSSAILTVGTGDLRVTTAGTNSASVVTNAGTQTLTNKRRTRRLTTTNAPGATPTTNTDNVDVMNFTGLATAITSMTTNLSGTPVDGDQIEFRFTDNGTARAITWGASFAATTIALPTTTVISTMLRVGFEWNGALWQCVATC